MSRTVIVVFLALGLTMSSCSDPTPPASMTIDGEAVTIAALPGGGFLWAERSGAVRNDTGETVGSVAADTDGQRGLLGLTVDPDGRVFVSYTDATFDLIVSELIDGEERAVWRGPTTVQGGNGGRMIFADGDLVIGIGLLSDREAQADPDAVVGKLIAIDPDAAPADQDPRILSGPWFNPFAFDQSPSGQLWVADNHPRDGEERVARGDRGLDPEVALVLPFDSAPSGLAATDDALYICSYNDQTLDRYDVAGDGSADGQVTFAETVADDCLLDVELLPDGDLVYSTGSAIVRLTP